MLLMLIYVHFSYFVVHNYLFFLLLFFCHNRKFDTRFTFHMVVRIKFIIWVSDTCCVVNTPLFYTLLCGWFLLLACWICGLESHRGHWFLSVESVVCCQIEVSATSWSLVNTPLFYTKDRGFKLWWMQRPDILFKLSVSFISSMQKLGQPWCTNTDRQIVQATTFYTVAPRTCRFWVLNLLYIPLPHPDANNFEVGPTFLEISCISVS
jgi:hypothetical protein